MSKFSIEAVFKAIDKMSGPMARMSAGLDRFNQRASKGISNLNSSVAKATDSLKSMALAAGGVGIAAGAGLLSFGKAGADFEQAITNVGAVSLMTRDQVADLEKKALELGASTKFSGTEVANAMEMMGKAGFTNAEILQGVGGVLSAAAADGGELAETASHISNVLKGMGLSTTETARVADVLTLASSRTNSSIGSLGESMKNVSSTARQLGVPLEETVSMVALLQDVGLDASEAGSSVATMLTMMAKPSDTMARKMKKLGVSFKDASGNMLAPSEVLAQLAKAGDGVNGNMEQVAFFADLVGMRGQKAAVNLKDMFKSGKVTSLVNELKAAEGSAKKMSDIRMDTLMGDIETLGGSIESVKIALFNTQSGPLRGVVQGIREWVDANQGIIESGFLEYINKATPIVKGFGEGVASSFREATPLVKGAASALGKLFGGDAAQGTQANAYFLARRITTLGLAFGGFVVATKAASVATVAFTAVTKTAQVSFVVLQAGVKGAQAAYVAFQIWTKIGTAQTIAMYGANFIAAGSFVATKVAAFGAATGLTTFGAVASRVVLPLAALASVLAAIQQAMAFLDENGGLEGLKAFAGLDPSTESGFAGIDAVMNRQAKARAAAEEQDRIAKLDPAERAQRDSAGAAVDKVFGGFGPTPQPSGFGLSPQAPAPAPASPQPASPWDGMPPEQLRELFKSTIDVNIKDKGGNVESVDVKSPNKTLAPKTARSGTP